MIEGHKFLEALGIPKETIARCYEFRIIWGLDEQPTIDLACSVRDHTNPSQTESILRWLTTTKATDTPEE